MTLQVTALMLAVEDLARSMTFYGEGLGGTIDQDYPNFVSFNLGEGSSSLALYEREAAAQYFSDPDGYLWKVGSGS